MVSVLKDWFERGTMSWEFSGISIDANKYSCVEQCFLNPIFVVWFTCKKTSHLRVFLGFEMKK